MLERNYSGQRAYGQSKLAQITAGFVLAERLAGSGITVNSLHPATYMPTKMVLDNGLPQIDSLEDGVAATKRLVSAHELAATTGKFFDRTREARALDQAYDPGTRERLWRLSLDLGGSADPT
jgi:NAD(P)-dependent dehydrogenase (short-subunit alcohol dehydrogenase family)